MVSNDRKRIVSHGLFDGSTAEKRGYPLSLKSFVTFVPFVGRNSGERLRRWRWDLGSRNLFWTGCSGAAISGNTKESPRTGRGPIHHSMYIE
jgi:hypothetical protein